ncbi:MAG TPA: helix-turn-helix domain-containing protein [candidate division Zixibacteria bacterium]|nr:helix-turn-helix domain-containing protein [candidate division Zixibacteria bacterium]
MSDEYSPQIMTVDEVATYLRVSQATIYRLAQAGKIPCGKVGRAWRFRKKTIDLWISEQPDSSNDPTLPNNELG